MRVGNDKLRRCTACGHNGATIQHPGRALRTLGSCYSRLTDSSCEPRAPERCRFPGGSGAAGGRRYVGGCEWSPPTSYERGSANCHYKPPIVLLIEGQVL